jgi:hypothetical protein
MKIPHHIYARVFDLASKLTDARETGGTKQFWDHYNELKEFCEAQDAQGLGHPFLWETLADYTDDDSASVALYTKALEAAQNPSTAEYRSSIQFALAERHKAMGNDDLAYKYALAANETAKNLDDLELRRAISDFLLDEAKGGR